MPHIKVTGKVNQITWNGKLIKVYESYTNKATQEIKSRLWSCWFDVAPDFNEGDEVSLNGELNCKIGTWTPKGSEEPRSVVEYHLNDVTISSVAEKVRIPFVHAPEPSPAVLEDLNTPF